MNTEKIKITSLIQAAPEKVWQFWTEPNHITGWNFASEDWCCPKAENDLKIGGQYKARMEAKDGSFGFDFEGVYEEVKPLETLAYALADGRIVRTTFEQEAEATRVTTYFDPEPENSVERQRDGWQAILENFKKYAETNA